MKNLLFPERTTLMLNSDHEMDFLFGFFLWNRFETIFEWGSGNSTLVLPRLAPWLKSWHAIEHVKEWFDSFEKKRIETSLTSKVCTHLFLPQQEIFKNDALDTKPGYLNYINSIDKISHLSGIKKFDLIIVDGRARVECARKAMEYMDEDSTMIVHDSKNAHYAPIFNMFDLVYQRITYSVFRLKK